MAGRLSAGGEGASVRSVAVAFVDITGSTALYERVGDVAASAAVKARVAQMRALVDEHGGVFVSANGDDVVSWFARADDALRAVAAMVTPPSEGALDAHGGVQWGEVVMRDGDVFGDSVNTAARLCALAKPRELLVDEALWAQLSAPVRATLTEVSPLRLKGKAAASRLFCRLCGAAGAATEVLDLAAAKGAAATREVVVRMGDAVWRVADGRSLTIGRADDNAVRVPAAIVSRRHATLAVADGQAEYSDHSAAGSFVAVPGREELTVHRRAVALSGDSSVSLGAPHDQADAPRLTISIAPPR